MEVEKLLEEGKSKIRLVELTKREFDYLCEQCMFSEMQEQILKDRIKGKSIIQISMEQNISEATVNREIKTIKKKISKII